MKTAWLRGAPNQPIRNPRRLSRNSPCPCGSGRKYKVCHGARQPYVPKPEESVPRDSKDATADVVDTKIGDVTVHDTGKVTVAVPKLYVSNSGD